MHNTSTNRPYDAGCTINPSYLEIKAQCDQTCSLTHYCNHQIFSMLKWWSHGRGSVTAKTHTGHSSTSSSYYFSILHPHFNFGSHQPPWIRIRVLLKVISQWPVLIWVRVTGYWWLPRLTPVVGLQVVVRDHLWFPFFLPWVYLTCDKSHSKAPWSTLWNQSRRQFGLLRFAVAVEKVWDLNSTGGFGVFEVFPRLSGLGPPDVLREPVLNSEKELHAFIRKYTRNRICHHWSLLTKESPWVLTSCKKVGKLETLVLNMFCLRLQLTWRAAAALGSLHCTSCSGARGAMNDGKANSEYSNVQYCGQWFQMHQTLLLTRRVRSLSSSKLYSLYFRI